MNFLFIIKSKKLQVWSHSVGITKYVYKVGLTKNPNNDCVEEFNNKLYAGRDDWVLILKKEIDLVNENQLIKALSSIFEMLNPEFYPQINNSIGLFKIKKNKVADNIILRDALKEKTEYTKPKKINDKDFAEYIYYIAQKKSKEIISKI